MARAVSGRDALIWRMMQLFPKEGALKVWSNRMARGLAIIRGSVIFRDCEKGARVAAAGQVKVVNRGSIRIDRLVTFAPGMIRSELVCYPGATIEIGEQCTFAYGVKLVAKESITIGRNCMFASFNIIADSDRDQCAPITIGDNVWMAHGVVVQPGVTIGSGSVISAKAVVSKDIPENSLAMGNPVRVMSLRMAAI